MSDEIREDDVRDDGQAAEPASAAAPPDGPAETGDGRRWTLEHALEPPAHEPGLPDNDPEPGRGPVYAPGYQVVSGPLPVCEYTGEGDDVPCEEPAVQKRWSSAAVITAASLGAVAGSLLMAAAFVWAVGLIPGVAPLNVSVPGMARSEAATITITGGDAVMQVSEAVARKVVPSVVNVTIFQEGVDPFSGVVRRREAGNGSGVIIREDGYILTNNHVIEGADEVVVTMGVEDLVATVVGTDPSSDLAVLKIDAEGLPAIEVGTSKDLTVGQWVMAVGSPFGLEKTVTVGIVSALNRSDIIEGPQDLTAYTNLIQTDAAINPGNSGGALVDAEGRLIGINTLIQSPSGAVGAPQSAGIGFAIPVDFAVDIADQLIADGRASHPYLGVSTESVNENIAARFGLPVSKGALVRFVQPGSPAEEAGIERGDIIVRIGETDVGGVADVFAGVRANRVGDEVEVIVVRGDTRRTLTATLGSDADRR